ncbi:MAG: flagellar biosynthesis protein FlhB [Bacteroidetes bacterium]|nr:flagellar biosynthesis protein FlhB [Bacteroidota bacterium]
MAERDFQERTEEPTPRRLERARQEGQVARSAELNSIVVLAAALGALSLLGWDLVRRLLGLVLEAYERVGSPPEESGAALTLLQDWGWQTLGALLPMLALLMASGLLVGFLQGGVHVTLKPLEPKLSRISPIAGFRRLFSSRGLMELLKSLLKLFVLILIAWFFIRDRLEGLFQLPLLGLSQIAQTTWGWLLALLGQAVLALAVIAGFDYAFQRWKHRRELRMSRQELKDEYRELEGHPQIKARLRTLMRQRRRKRRLDHAVLSADVVVTNPTHYAVALAYDPDRHRAPVVLAKGIRKMALRIRQLAQRAGIPVVEDPPTARALYALVEEGQEIPVSLYEAVAEILARVFRERNRMH